MHLDALFFSLAPTHKDKNIFERVSTIDFKMLPHRAHTLLYSTVMHAHVPPLLPTDPTPADRDGTLKQAVAHASGEGRGHYQVGIQQTQQGWGKKEMKRTFKIL